MRVLRRVPRCRWRVGLPLKWPNISTLNHIYLTNRTLSDPGGVRGSVGYRRGKVHLLLQALPHLLEPCPGICAVNDTPKNPRRSPTLAPLRRILFLGDPGVQQRILPCSWVCQKRRWHSLAAASRPQFPSPVRRCIHRETDKCGGPIVPVGGKNES
jgi:hypothetical protein